ncbi:ATP-binding protein [Kallipyga gabonensis]|uniref:ATP-binding protein n=1 Tax=Kallipyga gabonensis TaxID=1686287 RepID=UPI0006B641B1|nr:AAA family ATPase [Kallipyga gabonensis]
MVIQSIQLWAFGQIREESWTFSPGFQVIYGENESGKTTLMDAFQMAFYGSDRRTEDPRTNLRKRYLSDREGESRVQVRLRTRAGKSLRLDRTFGRTQSRDRVSLIDEETGKEILLERGQEPGAFLFDMDAETFRRTLFIDSGAGPMASNRGRDSLQEKIGRMASFGQEDLSLSAIVKSLEEEAGSLRSKSGHRGLLVDLEKERDRLMEEKGRAVRREEEEADMARRLASLKAHAERIREEAGRERSADLAQIFKKQEENAGKEEVLQNSIKRLERDHQAILEEKNQKEGRLSFMESALNQKKEEEEDPAKLRARYRKILDEGQAPEPSSLGLPAWICLVLAGLCALLAFQVESFRLPFSLLSLASLGAFLYFFRKRKKDWKTHQVKQKNALEEMAALQDRILSLEKGTGPSEEEERASEEIQVLREEVRGLADRLRDLEDEEGRARTQLDGVIREGQDLRERVIRREGDQAFSEEEERIWEEVRQMEAEIRARYGLEERAESLQVKIKRVEEKLAGLEERREALDLARRAFLAADEDRRRRLGPSLQRRTLDILDQLAPGRFESLGLDDRFHMSLDDRKDRTYYDWRVLSLGTGDQAYFSLRLALVEILEGEDHWPLFMDDPFVHYDDTRAEAGLSFLTRDPRQNNRQIFYFTCHGRILDRARSEEKIHIHYL